MPVKSYKALKEYIQSPQSKFFWFSLVLVFVLLILSLIYFPLVLKLVATLLLLALLVFIFFSLFTQASASSALKLEKALLDSIVKNLDDAVITYNQKFEILDFNKKAENLFQIKAKEIIGKKFSLQESAKNSEYDLLRKTIFPSLAPSIHKLSAPGKYPQIIAISFKVPYLELQVITIPIKDIKGEIRAFVKIVHDQTRQINLAKSKNEFVTITSHQLQTPLSAINWAFQELGKANLPAKDREEIFNTGAQAAKKLGNIVKDFLDVAKIEDGRFGFEFKKGDIVSFLSGIVDQASLLAQKYKVKVYFEKLSGKIELKFDAKKLAIAVSNLIDNAIKYNVENGQVLIRIQKLEDKPFVQISIEDTGMGVKAEDIDKLFTKFYRSKASTKVDVTGTGLGLYISRNIIRQHGGQIWAESILGRGATFHFTLPTDETLIPQREAIGLGSEE